MLCTIVWDTYADDERAAVWDALTRLLPPDSPDWARKGVYVFWDPDTHELLYVGLARDLPKRASPNTTGSYAIREATRGKRSMRGFASGRISASRSCYRQRQ